MVADGTGDLPGARDFVRSGLAITVLAYLSDAAVRRDLLALAGLRMKPGEPPCGLFDGFEVR